MENSCLIQVDLATRQSGIQLHWPVGLTAKADSRTHIQYPGVRMNLDPVYTSVNSQENSVWWVDLANGHPWFWKAN